MTGSTRLAALALLATLLAAAFLTFADTYEGETCTASSDGQTVCVSEKSTLVEQNGRSAYILLAAPIGVAAFGVWATIQEARLMLWPLVVALCLLSVVAVFSVGIFFAPAAILLLAAAARLQVAPAPQAGR